MLRSCAHDWRHRGITGDASPDEEAFIRELVRRFGSVIDVSGVSPIGPWRRSSMPSTLTFLSEHRSGRSARIALAHDEFRLARDLDFVCEDARGSG